MAEDKETFTDAEFDVVTPPTKPQWVKPKWWQGWYIDWRIAGIGIAISAVAFIARMKELSGR